MDSKTPIELTLDFHYERSIAVTMKKTVYAGFTPQHGMDVMDTEIVFRVRTSAMAGLSCLRHTGTPLKRGRFVEGSRKVTSKLFPKNESALRDSVEFFMKQGWTIQE